MKDTADTLRHMLEHFTQEDNKMRTTTIIDVPDYNHKYQQTQLMIMISP